jgi:hypothetical protein
MSTNIITSPSATAQSIAGTRRTVTAPVWSAQSPAPASSPA